MKSLLASILLVAGSASAMAQMSPVGLWRSVDDKTGETKAEIRIAESGGGLQGRIEKTLKKDAKADAVCEECTDDRGQINLPPLYSDGFAARLGPPRICSAPSPPLGERAGERWPIHLTASPSKFSVAHCSQL